MKIKRVACQNCGAGLDIEASVQFVTCNFCNTSLSVEHGESATFTRRLDQLESQTGEMADQLETLQIQNELERVDREWAMERESHLVTGEHGRTRVPHEVGAVVGSVVAVGFGIGWMLLAASMGAPVFFVMFGLVFIAVAIIGGVTGATKARGYRLGHNRYRRRRRAIKRQLRRRRRRRR